jgi:hypothetical protein
MNKTYKFLTALLSLLFLLLIACAEQKTKEPSSKLKTCEQDIAHTNKPYFSEFNNGWKVENWKTKNGVLFKQETLYMDSTKQFICREIFDTLYNICETNDTTINKYRIIYYNSNLEKPCDSFCKKGLVSHVSYTYSIKIKNKDTEKIDFTIETITTRPDDNDIFESVNELVLFKRDEALLVLDEAWTIAQRIRPITTDESIQHHLLHLVFDENRELCGAYSGDKGLEKNTPPYSKCKEQKGYTAYYSLRKYKN